MRAGPRGGLLLVGNPGNQGGSGRPKDRVRQAMLEAFEERLPKLRELANDPDPNVALKAMDMLAKYGVGTHNEVDKNLRDQRVLTREEREQAALTLIKGTKVG